MEAGTMRVTVIGAIAILAVAIAAALLIRHVNVRNSRGPQQNLS
ncbi:MAG TPA: hypothetical protein VFA89_01325 [Terriglobales bacterium]|nr:hypothetical protein [Terriglobales bacterium]